jgi:transcriptional regulator with XRE-family HTH domain
MGQLRKLLAGNLKTFRKEAGLTQEALAEKADTSPNYIAMLEAEKRFPSDTTLEKIAAALGKEPYELFSLEPSRKDWREEILEQMREFIDGKQAELEAKTT